MMVLTWAARNKIKAVATVLVLVVMTAAVTALAARVLAPSPEAAVNEALRSGLERQAELTRAVLEQNRQVAEAARRLVEADATARKDVIMLQREVQAERAALAAQSQALDEQRRELAAAREREPVVAAAVESLGLLLAVTAALALCGVVLWRIGAETDSSAVRDLLVTDLVSERPLLQPPRQAIDLGSTPALPPMRDEREEEGEPP